MNNRVRIFFVIIISLLFSSCCKKTASSTTFVNNTSGEYVSIIAYLNGGLNATIENTKIKNDSTYIDKNLTGYSFPSIGRSFLDADSLAVSFGTQKMVTHYAKGKAGNGITSLSFENPRNLLNEANYRRDVITDKKCSYYAEFYYTFTPEDAR